jgi:chemotaxis protein MotB
MARRRRHPEHANHERWLISYADFITLLFAFFVVMFASSQTDKSKAAQVSESVKDAFSNGGVKAAVHEVLGGTVDDYGKGNAMMRGPGGSQKIDTPKEDIPVDKVSVTELMPSMKYLTKSLANEIKDGKLDVHLEARGLVISLKQAAFFPSGGDDVAAAGLGSMAKIAEIIKTLPNQVHLEGHTDSIPIHNDHFKSNWDLSAARSIAILNLFCDKYGIDHTRFGIAGYADTVPVDTNDTAEGRAHNRRVDVVILNQSVIVKEEPAQEAKTNTTQANGSQEKKSPVSSPPTVR